MVEKWGEKGLDVRSDVGGRGDKEGGEGKWVKKSISPSSKVVTGNAAVISDSSPVRGAGARTGRDTHLRRSHVSTQKKKHRFFLLKGNL